MTEPVTVAVPIGVDSTAASDADASADESPEDSPPPHAGSARRARISRGRTARMAVVIDAGGGWLRVR
jgi:hypothetical protein